MANIKSQKKRNRQNERRHERNKAVRSELKTRVKVANTAVEAWKFKHLKRKTDRDDALRLAELEACVNS